MDLDQYLEKMITNTIVIWILWTNWMLNCIWMCCILNEKVMYGGLWPPLWPPLVAIGALFFCKRICLILYRSFHSLFLEVKNQTKHRIVKYLPLQLQFLSPNNKIPSFQRNNITWHAFYALECYHLSVFVFYNHWLPNLKWNIDTYIWAKECYIQQ